MLFFPLQGVPVLHVKHASHPIPSKKKHTIRIPICCKSPEARKKDEPGELAHHAAQSQIPEPDHAFRAGSQKTLRHPVHRDVRDGVGVATDRFQLLPFIDVPEAE